MIRRPVWFSAAFALVLAALALPAFSATPAQNDDKNYSKARIVRLSFVQGDVQISRPEEEDWERALVNMPVQQGYAIATGNGRAEIEFESGATVRLADNTQVQFNELALSNGDRITRMTLSQGSAIFYANLGRNDEFMVLTPGVQVTIPRNSRFRMDVTERHVNVVVSKGDVTVETQAGNYKVSKGKALLFDTRGAENAIVARAGDTDEFDRWAAERDDTLNSSRAASLQYVSAPFRYGVSDLSRHGSWVYAASYGYVWQPYGVSVGWTPFYDGRWVYVRGHGWTWVSYEPWGWLPYHYGSWAFISGRWGWVPGALYSSMWHPGTVIWINIGGGRHGWCPRSPFDRPGRIHHNVNIRNTVIVNTGGGIVGGGRHERLERFDRIQNTRFDGEGPRRRDHFGNVDEIRRGFGGRNLTTGNGGRGTGGRPGGNNDDERGRPAGRTDERFVKGTDGLPRPSVGSTGGAVDANASTGVSRGFGGRPGGPEGRRLDNENGRPAGRTDAQPDSPQRGFGGRTELPSRNRETDTNDDNVDRRRSRFGSDPNGSVQFDSDRRRFENQPQPEASGRQNGPGGRRDNNEPSQRPQARPESQDRGWGGSRPTPSSRSNDEPRSRQPESRPETRPEPRRESRPESRPSESRPSSSSGGGWGGGGSSRPSSPPPAPSSGGGGGFGGGGGSRPSSPAPAPAPAPAPRPSGGGGRPGRPS